MTNEEQYTPQSEENAPVSDSATTTAEVSATTSAGNAAMDMDIKAQKFREIANRRVNEACKKISLIGNLASPAYHSTPEQRETIINAMQAQIDDVKAKFDTIDKATTKPAAFVSL